ncbi:MAG: 50S ribosomal protein L18, partial [Bacilli bacterium]
MIKKRSRNEARLIRHKRIRNRIKGTSSVPRLNVFRSNAHIYAQI